MAITASKPAINIREKLAELDQPQGIKGTEVLRADTADEARNAIGARGRKNLIINGGMGIAQRSTSVITVANDSNEGYQTIDRMFTTFNAAIGGAVTVQRVDDAPAGIANSLKYVVTSTTTPSGNQYFGLEHKLESQNLQSVGYGTAEAKDMTLSFYMKSSNYSGSVSIAAYHADAVRYFTATAGTPTADWRRYSVVIPANTANIFNKNDNGEGLRLRINLDCSSTNKAASSPTGWTSSRKDAVTGDGHFMATSGNEVYLTGLQLELGNQATDFEHRSYGEELALCQRYYQKHSLAQRYIFYYTAPWSYSDGVIDLPVEMRIAPTIAYGFTAVPNAQPGGGGAGNIAPNGGTPHTNYVSLRMDSWPGYQNWTTNTVSGGNAENAVYLDAEL